MSCPCLGPFLSLVFLVCQEQPSRVTRLRICLSRSTEPVPRYLIAQECLARLVRKSIFRLSVCIRRARGEERVSNFHGI
ncbi:hypothetical protein CPC08DRAFT_243938 [Agrocybe pediades]|nr:hypothetical protein CPC08DRAFT_243938 [Agrocybe pediades]